MNVISARGRCGHATRDADYTAQPRWVPTPEEIACECARLRATWSARERERRAVRQPRWTAPQVSLRVEM